MTGWEQSPQAGLINVRSMVDNAWTSVQGQVACWSAQVHSNLARAAGTLNVCQPSTSQPVSELFFLSLSPIQHQRTRNLRRCSTGAGQCIRLRAPFASLSESALPSAKLLPPGTTLKPKVKAVPATSEGAGGQEEPEDRILISEVEVVGVDGELRQIAESALTTKPNFAYTLGEVKADVQRVFATGWFKGVEPDAQDTRDGVKLVLRVTPNAELRSVETTGAHVLPQEVIDNAFEGLQGATLNFVGFQKAVKQLDEWYQERGLLAQVADFTFDESSGAARLTCAEAVVNDVQLAFIDGPSGQPNPNPRTKRHIITRHLTTTPGKVYNLEDAKRDIAAVYATGLFEDVTIVPKEAEDSTESEPKLDLTLRLVERKTGGLGAGTGISAASHGEGAMPGFVGSFTYSERNLRGLNQRLIAQVELGAIDKTFKLQHSDPWVNSNPHHTSRTITLMNNRASGAVIHGRIEAEAEDDASQQGAGSHAVAGGVLLGRLISSVEWRRPFGKHWAGSMTMDWQRTRTMDERGISITRDTYGSPLTFTGADCDTRFATTLSTTYSNPRNDAQAVASIEQTIPAPFFKGLLNYTRLQLRVDRPIALGPFTLLLRGRCGTVIGDLPPYEAFPIGGTNSTRGYAEGGVGSGRHLAEGTAELRWPLFKGLGATLFADYGSDLNSGASVVGDPAGVRNKPGVGYGYGGGIRVDSPIGPVRLEYAYNADRVGRFHVGLGYS